MKNIYLLILLLVINGCDTPQTYQCSNGQTMDDCGNCRDCESEECGWNNIIDECGICDGSCNPTTSGNGNGASDCFTCWNEELVCNISECDDYNPETWFIDLQFLIEDFYCISDNPEYNSTCEQYLNENTCELFSDNYECSWIATFEISTNTPIFWEKECLKFISSFIHALDRVVKVLDVFVC